MQYIIMQVQMDCDVNITFWVQLCPNQTAKTSTVWPGMIKRIIEANILTIAFVH